MLAVVVLNMLDVNQWLAANREQQQVNDRTSELQDIPHGGLSLVRHDMPNEKKNSHSERTVNIRRRYGTLCSHQAITQNARVFCTSRKFSRCQAYSRLFTNAVSTRLPKHHQLDLIANETSVWSA